MNCPYCNAFVLPGPACCKQHVLDLVAAHEAMAAKVSGDVADRAREADVMAREVAALDGLAASLPTKDRGEATTRLAALVTARSTHAAKVETDKRDAPVSIDRR